MARRVLLVRVQPGDLAPSVREALKDRYPTDVVEFQYVNPATPEELMEISSQPDVAAVYLQERALPSLVVQEGRIPW